MFKSSIILLNILLTSFQLEEFPLLLSWILSCAFNCFHFTTCWLVYFAYSLDILIVFILVRYVFTMHVVWSVCTVYYEYWLVHYVDLFATCMLLSIWVLRHSWQLCLTFHLFAFHGKMVEKQCLYYCNIINLVHFYCNRYCSLSFEQDKLKLNMVNNVIVTWTLFDIISTQFGHGKENREKVRQSC